MSIIYNNKDYKKIARYEDDTLIVDTGSVQDGVLPYETTVSHPEYNEGHMIVVEAYLTEPDALGGHAEWTDKMLHRKPEYLEDVCNAHISRFAKDIGATTRWERVPKFEELEGEKDEHSNTTVPKD
jgi:hypothetical protein